MTRLDPGHGENSHRHPRFLPDGRHFLYLARLNGATEQVVMVGSIDGEAPREILRSPAAAEFTSGHLFFLRGLTLFARPFDAASLAFRGEARPLAEDVRVVAVGPSSAALAVFSVSPAGLLAYQTTRSTTPRRRLVWHDADGREAGSLAPQGDYADLRIAPRGDLAVVTLRGARPDGTTVSDLWVVDLARNLRSRLTSVAPKGDAWAGVWERDGRGVVFSCDLSGQGHWDLCRQGLSDTVPEVLFRSKDNAVPDDFSPDGRWLLFETSMETGDAGDLWLLPLEGPREPRPWLKTLSVESSAAFSPDGRYVAYSSDQSGRDEVYVMPFLDRGRRWQVSAEGGMAPDWQRDGKRLYYRSPGGTVHAVDVDTQGEEIRIGSTRSLFRAARDSVYAQLSAVTPDARRILALEPVPEAPAPEVVNVLVNWPARRVRATGSSR